MERYFSLGILAGGCLAALVFGAEQRVEKGQLPAATRLVRSWKWKSRRLSRPFPLL